MAFFALISIQQHKLLQQAIDKGVPRVDVVQVRTLSDQHDGSGNVAGRDHGDGLGSTFAYESGKCDGSSHVDGARRERALGTRQDGSGRVPVPPRWTILGEHGVEFYGMSPGFLRSRMPEAAS